MPLKTHQDELPTINLTSMIDVVFLLIIFFMVGTKFTQLENQLELELPTIGPTQALISQPRKKQVNVMRDGSIALDGMKLSTDELTRSLQVSRSQFPGLGVELSGDGRASWEMIAPALQAIQLAGVDRLRINVHVAVMNR